MEKALLVPGIFGAIMLALVGASIFWNYQTAAERHDNAVELAHQWSSEIYGEDDVRISCQSTDSDSNGYVSCTVMHEDQLIPIECASYVLFNLGDTCRPLSVVGIRR